MPMRELDNGRFRVRAELSMTVDSHEEAERLDRLLASALDDAKRRFLRGDRPCCSIREIMEDFLDQQEIWRGNSKSTIAAYRRRLEMFADAFGDKPLDRIAREELQEWIRRRVAQKGKRRRYHPGKGVSRDTVNNDLKALRRFCDWAAECGHAPAGLEIMTVPKLHVKGKIRGNRFPPRALVRQNFMHILRRIRKAAPHVALVLRAMLLLGGRPEAIFALRWRDVELPRGGNGEVKMPPLKGGAEGSVPVACGSHLHDVFTEARQIFRKFHGRRPNNDDPVFCTMRGRSRRRALGWKTDVYGHELDRVCSKLGIEGFTAYTARHSAVTWLQQQPGVSNAAVQAYARHLRVSTQDAYSHRSGADGEPAYHAMESVLGRHSGRKRGVPENGDMEDMVSALQGIELAMDCED